MTGKALRLGSCMNGGDLEKGMLGGGVGYFTSQHTDLAGSQKCSYGNADVGNNSDTY